jgi:hypothetical protein
MAPSSFFPRSSEYCFFPPFNRDALCRIAIPVINDDVVAFFLRVFLGPYLSAFCDGINKLVSPIHRCARRYGSEPIFMEGDEDIDVVNELDDLMHVLRLCPHDEISTRHVRARNCPIECRGEFMAVVLGDVLQHDVKGNSGAWWELGNFHSAAIITSV